MIGRVLVYMSSVAVAGLGTAALLKAPSEHCLASFSTSLEKRSRNQRHNALLSVLKLDGAIIKPGQTFSFNQRVGSFSRDGGYRKAPVSYNGQLIDSFGGGVCQTSTTTYNAALLAGLDIVERNRHRFSPSYVLPGRDAAVAYSTIDLRFRNPYAFPIKIQAKIEADQLRVGIYGAGQSRPCRIVTDVRQVHEPSTFEIGDRRAAGRMRNTGKQGFFVQVFRLMNGQKELVSSDNYPVMDIVVDRR